MLKYLKKSRCDRTQYLVLGKLLLDCRMRLSRALQVLVGR